MRRSLLVIPLIVALALLLWIFRASPAAQEPKARLEAARSRVTPQLQERFARAGVHYPATAVFLRAFKHEGVLELWAKNEGQPFCLVHAYPVLASSGGPGPKRREGDRQVPEGCYKIDRFNPASLYHLSLGLDYPNAADRILSDPKQPGSDIFIHGGDATVGCLPLGDEAIEEVFVICQAAENHEAVPVHIFPARMSGESWSSFAAPFKDQPKLTAFWQQLQPIYDAFMRDKKLPPVIVNTVGEYILAQP